MFIVWIAPVTILKYSFKNYIGFERIPVYNIVLS